MSSRATVPQASPISFGWSVRLPNEAHLKTQSPRESSRGREPAYRNIESQPVDGLRQPGLAPFVIPPVGSDISMASRGASGRFPMAVQAQFTPRGTATSSTVVPRRATTASSAHAPVQDQAQVHAQPQRRATAAAVGNISDSQKVSAEVCFRASHTGARQEPAQAQLLAGTAQQRSGSPEPQLQIKTQEVSHQSGGEGKKTGSMTVPVPLPNHHTHGVDDSFRRRSMGHGSSPSSTAPGASAARKHSPGASQMAPSPMTNHFVRNSSPGPGRSHSPGTARTIGESSYVQTVANHTGSLQVSPAQLCPLPPPAARNETAEASAFWSNAQRRLEAAIDTKVKAVLETAQQECRTFASACVDEVTEYLAAEYKKREQVFQEEQQQMKDLRASSAEDFSQIRAELEAVKNAPSELWRNGIALEVATLRAKVECFQRDIVALQIHTGWHPISELQNSICTSGTGADDPEVSEELGEIERKAKQHVGALAAQGLRRAYGARLQGTAGADANVLPAPDITSQLALQATPRVEVQEDTTMELSVARSDETLPRPAGAFNFLLGSPCSPREDAIRGSHADKSPGNVSRDVSTNGSLLARSQIGVVVSPTDDLNERSLEQVLADSQAASVASGTDKPKVCDLDSNFSFDAGTLQDKPHDLSSAHVDATDECNTLGFLLRDYGQLLEAAKILRGSLETRCAKLDGLLKAQDTTEPLELLKLALMILERAAAKDFDEGSACANLGQILAGLGPSSTSERVPGDCPEGQEQRGIDHDVANSTRLNLDEAELLMRRALTVSERVLGPEHPIVTSRCGNLANLLALRERFEEARGCEGSDCQIQPAHQRSEDGH